MKKKNYASLIVCWYNPSHASSSRSSTWSKPPSYHGSGTRLTSVNLVQYTVIILVFLGKSTQWRATPRFGRFQHRRAVLVFHANQIIKLFNVLWRKCTRTRREIVATLLGLLLHAAVGGFARVIRPSAFLVPSGVPAARATRVNTIRRRAFTGLSLHDGPEDALGRWTAADVAQTHEVDTRHDGFVALRLDCSTNAMLH